jgi:cysteine desulfurase family protein (TIGR01976 family)
MLDINKIREKFPSLNLKDSNGNDIIYLDGPGGTQVPSNVINGISNYYKKYNANTHGEFITSIETDRIMGELRSKAASLLGAEDGKCISIGQNMTSLNFSLARCLSKIFNEGDELIISELDHEANRGPWKTLEDIGVKIIEIELMPNGELDYDDFSKKINDKTVMVAVGMSSNALGTMNKIDRIRDIVKKYKCLFLLDAVHYAPHFSIDVKKLDCDFLLCSAYKFYGPHMSFLYSRPGLLDKLDTDRLIVQDQGAPYRIETGTLNHAACHGVSKAIDFISELGIGTNYREKIIDSYKKLSHHEFTLASQLFEGLNKLKNIQIIGPDFSSRKRTPTVSFIHKSKSANEICRELARHNICAWDGHFYALKAIQKLGLEKKGGVTRLGISVYNQSYEIDKTIKALSEI